MTAITLPIRRLAIAMTAAAALSACTGAPQAAASSTLVRADSLLRGYTAMPAARQAAVADSLRPAIDAMAAVGIMDGTSSRDISNYVEGRAFAFFEDGVEEQFTCGDSISGVLDSIRAGLAAQFPDVEWPKVYGIVSPYRQAIVNADSVSLIALNHYLGSDYEAYSGFEPYVRRQKSPQLLPYQFTEALLMRDYPQPVDSVGSRPSDVLAVMAHDGAVACAMLRVIPSASIAEVGGGPTVSLHGYKRTSRTCSPSSLLTASSTPPTRSSRPGSWSRRRLRWLSGSMLPDARGAIWVCGWWSATLPPIPVSPRPASSPIPLFWTSCIDRL